MRFLALGDTHGDHRWLSTTILEYAPRHNVTHIVQLGDFGYFPDNGEELLDRTEKKLAQNGIKFFFIDGNHDAWNTLIERNPHRDDDGFYRVRDHMYYCPRGHRWEWDGVSYLALGGAYSIDKWERITRESFPGNRTGQQWFPEELITTEQMFDAVQGGEVDVMITHDAPWGVPIPNPDYKADEMESNLNRFNLLEVVKTVRPDILLHGHYHVRISGELPVRISDEDTFDVQIEGLAHGQHFRKEQAWTVLDFLPKGN